MKFALDKGSKACVKGGLGIGAKFQPEFSQFGVIWGRKVVDLGPKPLLSVLKSATIILQKICQSIRDAEVNYNSNRKRDIQGRKTG